MAKLAFSKLKLKNNDDVVHIFFNEQDIEVKQYLPIEDKIILATNVISQSNEEEFYANPIKVEWLKTLNIIMFYTNLSFTEKQQAEGFKIYDLVCGNGLYTQILNAIPAEELSLINTLIDKSIESIYQYHNSFLGVMSTIGQDYINIGQDAEKYKEELANKDNLAFLREIMGKLG